jgi:hypothetical protein
MNNKQLTNEYSKLYAGTSTLTIREAITVLRRRNCKVKALRAFHKSNDGFHGRAKKYYLTAFKFDK